MITSGLLDLQVNGFAGVDFNDAGLTPQCFGNALQALLATGVTQFLPTLITADEKTLSARFKALDQAVITQPLAQAMVPGYHLEGPFLNPAPGFSGCHPAAAMIAPDIKLVDRLRAKLSKPILLITIAPELPGSSEFIKQARERNIGVAIGHSDARLDMIDEAVMAGATFATHLGNGVAHQMHKFDNSIVAQAVNDKLWGCFILDGIHVPAYACKMLLRAKSLEKSILVTDAVSAAHSPVGHYPFAGMMVERSMDGSVRDIGTPYLAGSSLTMDQGIRNLVGFELCGFEQAIQLGSTNPRKALYECDIKIPENGSVTWSEDMMVVETRISGEILYKI
jgi:N-acetylglucosamine-6-phosphate deacetylase